VNRLVAAMAALLWVVSAARMVEWVRQRKAGQGVLLLTLLGLAVSATFFVPAVYVEAEQVTGVPNVAEPIARTGLLGAAWGAQELILRLTVRPHSAYIAARLHLVVLLTTAAALWLLFIAASLDEPTLSFTSRYGREPLVALYLMLSLGYLAFALLDVAMGALQWASRSSGSLRRGLLLVVGGCATGGGYIAIKTLALTMLALGAPVPSQAEATWGRTLAVLAGLLVTTGSGQPWLSKAGRAASSWWSSYRAYRCLGPLWRDLADVRPIAFHQVYSLPSRLRQGMTAIGMHELLYRRIIEIRDGRLGIRPFLDGAVEEDARRSSSDDDVEAVVEAALLTAGIRAAHLDNRPTRLSSTLGPVAADLKAEVAWLTRVARRYPTASRLDGSIPERITA
jgi:hypothetical protein